MSTAATVLLVEDAQDLGPLLLELVEEWGRPVVLARTGAEAMEALARQPVALLILDHDLPDMTGSELLERLRSEHRCIPPVVLMTAGICSETGGDWPELVEVLPKPFELCRLMELLDRRLPRC